MPSTYARNSLGPFIVLTSVALVTVLLWWAQAVVIPIALATLLTFLLAPVVQFLQKWRLNRIAAVTVVVTVAALLLAGMLWAVVLQSDHLAEAIPEYERNLEEKIRDLGANGRNGFFSKVSDAAARISRTIRENLPVSEGSSTHVQPVEVVNGEGPLSPATLWGLIGSLLEPIATAGLVVVLVVYMLIRREDLRDRLISLLGRGRLTATTKALDEAGQRISRYLLAQLIVNGSFGAAVGIGLFLIGIPYAFLWGLLAAILRYIPYLGPWLAALLPLGLSLLAQEGWTAPLAVLALFLTLELISNMIMEPWFYGKNIGVSEAMALISIAFWTWLWGPMGLMLAMPLTVCMAVLGRYVPFLTFFDTLLSDQPPLSPAASFYQRLLAHDEDEALEIAESFLKDHALEGAFDELIVPAMIAARRDVDSHQLTADERAWILGAVGEIAEQLSGFDRAKSASDGALANSPSDSPASVDRPLLLGVPARDVTDEAAMRLLERLFDAHRSDWQAVRSVTLSSELVALVQERQPQAVCISALPPGGLSHARYLCLRLRAANPQLKIVVGRWGLVAPADKNRELLLAAGADYVGLSLAETQKQIHSALLTASPRDTSVDASSKGSERGSVLAAH